MRLRGRSRLSSTAASRAPWLYSEHSRCASAHRLGSARRSWVHEMIVARGCRLDDTRLVSKLQAGSQSRQARPEEAQGPSSGTADEGWRLTMPPRRRVLLPHETVIGELHAQQPRDHACS
eukprot:scaffold23369_cov67-Phaeocystis_antarctica.AAC.1